MAYKEVENTGIWLPEEEGSALEGSVKEIKNGEYGLQIVLEDKDGALWATPSHKVLQNRLSKIVVGDKIKIVYEGTEAPSIKGHSPTRMYKLFKDE